MVEKRKYTSAATVSLPTELLEKVDRDAQANFDTRSGRISEIIRLHYRAEKSGNMNGNDEEQEITGVRRLTVTSQVSAANTSNSYAVDPSPTSITKEVLDPE